jgi:Asp-tRNA(Asn)/Glu-tRNA(Gln) amidotransferase A subunit family amidase
MSSNDAMKDALRDILNLRAKIAQKQEEAKEAVKALAERFDRKPAEINKIIGTIEKERSKGGVIADARALLDEAEEML